MDETTILSDDARAQALLAEFVRAGYERADPPILQPAEPFLDLSGEDIRSRMFLTADPDGVEFCLRPDLTIPVSRNYLASARAGTSAQFSYLGTVFRHRDDAPGEFLQAGVESFGRADKAAADAEMITLGLEAAAHYGIDEPDMRMGDVALFSALLAALDLAPAWQRRLLKDFNRKASLASDLDRLSLGAALGKPEYQGVLAAVANSNPDAARALIADLLSIAGIATVGGRSVDEIADRFLEQAMLGASTRLPREARALIERFLSIAGDPDVAAADIRDITEAAGVTLGPAIDEFESRTGFLAAHGVDVARIRFETAFGRGFDYYTGLVFELHDPLGRAPGQLVAGGRYDLLLSRLGAPSPIPAVGFSAWIDRLAALGGGA